MVQKMGIDLLKQENPEHEQPEYSQQIHDLQEWHNDINAICKLLSVSTSVFKENLAYSSIEAHVAKYKRWLYSDISGYLFACDEQANSIFFSNLDRLQLFARKRLSDCTNKERSKVEKMVVVIDKLWDHANLAQKQNASLHDSDDSFRARFDNNLIPFKASFTQDMNMQFISLIAIFTALSFIVFGGISSLDNIFSGAKSIPIIQLLIIGSIWSLCITNLVFVFMFFISKLTKISIKSSEQPNASISQRYPFVVWSNFTILLVLACACWLYYIDYSNSGGWLLHFSHERNVLSFFLGLLVVLAIFVPLAIVLLRKPKQENSKQQSATVSPADCSEQ